MAENVLTDEKRQAAARQGDAYKRALALMQQDADVFESKKADDYIVSIALEEAEGMYFPVSDTTLDWEVPAKEMNKHLEVVVQDSQDGRFVPGLELFAVVTDADGTVMYDDVLSFLWHPFLWHYGNNLHIDGPGTYEVTVTIRQPLFGRHDEQNGKRYPRDVEITFDGLELKPGRKPHGAE